MGDLSKDTEIVGGDGEYVAQISTDWRIWGPNGGYLAAIALRAAARDSAFQTPASFFCHFLSVGRFEEVRVLVDPIRRGRSADSLRVKLVQSGKLLLEAMVWLSEPGPGLVHDDAPMPEAEPPEKRRSWAEIFPGGSPGFPFWNNIEGRPIVYDPDPDGPSGDPRGLCWHRFTPVARFDDPVLEACRSLILIDTVGWPAAHNAHRHEDHFVAPSLDVSAQFHRPARSEWLLAESHAPVAEEGRVGALNRIWNEAGQLVATGTGTLLMRPAPDSVS